MFEIKNISDVDLTENPVIAQMSQYNHEELLFCNDNDTGLKAIIAVHNTVLGPALGGTRIWAYNNEMEALNDVLRLSRGMTYKNSLAGLNLGGGKAVIIGDSRQIKSEALMRRFGKFVNSLGGNYITAEDVGISPADMVYVNMETNHVVGLPGKSGDPSPVTARGVYVGMKACAKEQFGTDSLAGRKIAVQGVGHVGEYLVESLTKEGAEVFITDVYEPTLKRVSETYGAKVVGLNEIYDLDVDIYAPCALGATVNDETLSRLKCSIIAGAANNQLKVEAIHGQAVMDRGIIYAPDFALNAGGVINCYSEVAGLSPEWALRKADDIYSTISTIVRRSKEEQIPTYQIANRMAEERIEKVGKVKLPR
ncbi:Glu/Leu/Phe/Val dehydrogenase [Crocinitomicaceae bacterium CZZ-1]|uniref:Glu/Leu/Phe/Val dehydrogenase n=1 Tax=Taishania pollutisoli TaxID=2766479 RepID=A0A8J6U208_9FLAO|nr:Glu/Leu/Phe/Val dehydrogenase [Taishania pollutisoli]MBC9811890.1 Glu/Leu/Phe/Val dehydrogenase [Taishania pollutisoli]MBX2948167.1 Glu/Leu/Phe/Val dehydrogenase [Crocinitomicaceae bacterium]NGF75273.1 Glu/Leu/Phe/Val dehydrogenase [Fluviicola sp. SGL-29]